MTDLVRQSRAVVLLENTGIGPVTAAIAVAVWSHPGRVRFGSCARRPRPYEPYPCLVREYRPPSTQPRRRPALEPRLHIATITRMTHDPATRDHVENGRAEGRIAKEIRRCLKRYLARQIYRALNATDATPCIV